MLYWVSCDGCVWVMNGGGYDECWYWCCIYWLLVSVLGLN